MWARILAIESFKRASLLLAVKNLRREITQTLFFSVELKIEHARLGSIDLI